MKKISVVAILISTSFIFMSCTPEEFTAQQEIKKLDQNNNPELNGPGSLPSGFKFYASFGQEEISTTFQTSNFVKLREIIVPGIPICYDRFGEFWNQYHCNFPNLPVTFRGIKGGWDMTLGTSNQDVINSEAQTFYEDPEYLSKPKFDFIKDGGTYLDNYTMNGILDNTSCEYTFSERGEEITDDRLINFEENYLGREETIFEKYNKRFFIYFRRSASITCSGVKLTHFENPPLDTTEEFKDFYVEFEYIEAIKKEKI